MYEPESEKMENIFHLFRKILKVHSAVNYGYHISDSTPDIFYNLIVNGELEAVQLLLKFKPDLIYVVNDYNNATPLHRASYFNKKEIVELFLIINHELAYVSDKEGKFPLEYAISECHSGIVTIFEDHAPLDNVLDIFNMEAKKCWPNKNDNNKYQEKSRSLLHKCANHIMQHLPIDIAHEILEFIVYSKIIESDTTKELPPPSPLMSPLATTNLQMIMDEACDSGHRGVDNTIVVYVGETVPSLDSADGLIIAANLG